MPAVHAQGPWIDGELPHAPGSFYEVCHAQLGTWDPDAGPIGSCLTGFAVASAGDVPSDLFVDLGFEPTGPVQLFFDPSPDADAYADEKVPAGTAFDGDITRGFVVPAVATRAGLDAAPDIGQVLGLTADVEAGPVLVVGATLASDSPEGVVTNLAFHTNDNPFDDPTGIVGTPEAGPFDTTLVAGMTPDGRPIAVAGSLAKNGEPGFFNLHRGAEQVFVVDAAKGVPLGPFELGTVSMSEVVRGPLGDIMQAGPAGNTRFGVGGRAPVAFPVLDAKLTHKGGTLRIEGLFKSILPPETLDGATIVMKGWFSNGTKPKYTLKAKVEPVGDGCYRFSGTTKMPKDLKIVRFSDITLQGVDAEAAADWHGQLVDEGVTTGPFDASAVGGWIDDEFDLIRERTLSNVVVAKGGAAFSYDLLPVFAARLAAPESIEGDVDGDGSVEIDDLVALFEAWGAASPTEDLDGDGTVGPGDLQVVIQDWGRGS